MLYLRDLDWAKAHENMLSPLLDALLLVSCQVQPDPSQHVRKLFSGEHPAAAFVRFSETHAETLDLCQMLFGKKLEVRICLIGKKRSVCGDCAEGVVTESRQHSCGRRQTSQACGYYGYAWRKNARRVAALRILLVSRNDKLLAYILMTC